MSEPLDIGPIKDRLSAARGDGRSWQDSFAFGGSRAAIQEFDYHARKDVIDLLAEVQRLRAFGCRTPACASPVSRIVYVSGTPYEGWKTVFLDGVKVGYYYHDKLKGGWEVALNKSYGAPKDVNVVYLTEVMAIARIEKELLG